MTAKISKTRTEIWPQIVDFRAKEANFWGREVKNHPKTQYNHWKHQFCSKYGSSMLQMCITQCQLTVTRCHVWQNMEKTQKWPKMELSRDWSKSPKNRPTLSGALKLEKKSAGVFVEQVSLMPRFSSSEWPSVRDDKIVKKVTFSISPKTRPNRPKTAPRCRGHRNSKKSPPGWPSSRFL